MKYSDYYLKTKPKKNKLLLKVFVSLFTLTTLIAAITFYGLNTGNFTVGVSKEAHNQNISVSTKPNSDENKKSIIFNSRKILPYDFNMINSSLEEIINEDGEYLGKSSKNILSYSFYLKNESPEKQVDINYYINLKKYEETSDSLKHVKFMFIIDNQVSIYHNKQSNIIDYPKHYNVNEFNSNSKNIIEGSIYRLNQNSEKRISILIWYEGSQISNDLNSEDLESLKMQIVFEVAKG